MQATDNDHHDYDVQTANYHDNDNDDNYVQAEDDNYDNDNV